MNELESVDIICMSGRPKRIRSCEVIASQNLRISFPNIREAVRKGLLSKVYNFLKMSDFGF